MDLWGFKVGIVPGAWWEKLSRQVVCGPVLWYRAEIFIASALVFLPKDGFKTRLLSRKRLSGTAMANNYEHLPKKLLDISVALYYKLAATSAEL